MVITNHILHGVEFKQTPNISGERITPKYLVIHYSASGTLAGTVRHLTKKGSGVSAHLVIGRDGKVVQLASFDQRAWHCGKSEWMGETDLNDMSIGIELVNWGKLEHDELGFRSWLLEGIVDEQAAQGRSRTTGENAWWHTFTPEQLKSCFQVAEVLVRAYQLTDILGHEDIAMPRGRKLDPGPLFPLDELRAYCYPPPVVEPEPPRVFAMPRLSVEKNGDGLKLTMGRGVFRFVSSMNKAEAEALRDWLTKVFPA